MIFEELPIQNVILIKPEIFSDQRGYFLETFQKEKFMQAGIILDILQQNQSGSNSRYSKRSSLSDKTSAGKTCKSNSR